MRPDTFSEWEREEEEFRRVVGKDVAILRDREGGITTPLTLQQLRLRIEEGQRCDTSDWGGCNCFGGED